MIASDRIRRRHRATSGFTAHISIALASTALAGTALVTAVAR
jgi:hypothetical protein